MAAVENFLSGLFERQPFVRAKAQTTEGKSVEIICKAMEVKLRRYYAYSSFNVLWIVKEKSRTVLSFRVLGVWLSGFTNYHKGRNKIKNNKNISNDNNSNSNNHDNENYLLFTEILISDDFLN